MTSKSSISTKQIFSGSSVPELGKKEAEKHMISDLKEMTASIAMV